MSLYRHDATGFLCEYATSPGAGYTAVSAMPGDVAGRVTWWRQRCVDAALGQSSVWHPSLPSSTELALPPGTAGRGVNVVPARYSMWNEDVGGAGGPTIDDTGTTITGWGVAAGLPTSKAYLNIQATASNGKAWFSTSATDYNGYFAAYRRWIISANVAASSSGARTFYLLLKTSTGTTYSVGPFTTSATANVYQRVYGAIDLSADGGGRFVVGVQVVTTGSGGAIRTDNMMVEELIGDTVTPSPFVAGISPVVEDGQVISLPGDIVGGFQVQASSIHSIQITKQTSVTLPTGTTGFTSTTINLTANNYRTAVIMFFDLAYVTTLYQEGWAFHFYMKRGGSTVDDSFEWNPRWIAQSGNYFRRFSGFMVDASPGVGSLSYNFNLTHDAASAIGSPDVKIMIVELSR